jgi:hypothetical protein
VTEIIGGGVRFELDAPATPFVLRLAEALAVEFEPDRVITDEARYYVASALGLRLHLELRETSPRVECALSYVTDDRYHAAGSEVVNLDFHFIRVLAAVGVQARPLHE